MTVSILGNSQIATYLDIPYHSIDTVDQNLLSFDAYIPEISGPKPIIFYVHGGGWVSGDKSVFGKKMKLFTDMGYMFISINYRLSPIPYQLDNPDRVKYPQHPDDVARAIAYILEQAQIYGGDTERVAIIGHSSGAHIVSLIMTDASFLNTYGHSPDEIKCLCSLDTGAYDINLWLGSASDATKELYTNAFSADTLVRMQASPAHNVDKSDNLASTLLVHQSTVKRIYISTLFADTLSKYGAIVKKISTDYSHGEINQKIGDFSTETSTEYTQEITDWFKECLYNAVSTSEYEKSNLKIYPNPTSDFIKITENAHYQVVNMQGQTLMHGYGSKIEVRHLESAIYLLALKIGTKEYRELIFIE